MRVPYAVAFTVTFPGNTLTVQWFRFEFCYRCAIIAQHQNFCVPPTEKGFVIEIRETQPILHNPCARFASQTCMH